jgi:hypothetical protein
VAIEWLPFMDEEARCRTTAFIPAGMMYKGGSWKTSQIIRWQN